MTRILRKKEKNQTGPIVSVTWRAWFSCSTLNRVVKCDITKTKICELKGFVEIIQEIKTKNVSLSKTSMLVQIVGEILPLLFFNDSIQILLKMAWFLRLGTKPI